MKHALRIQICLLAATLATSHAFAAGNASNGKKLAESCAGCHGEDGNSNAPIFPKLAGQQPSYLAKQLYDFKSEKRNEPTMTAMSAPLSDADIADLSAYYAERKIKAEAVAPNERGKNLFHTGEARTGLPACSGCHGPEAKGNQPAAYPALRGQHAAYLTKTLHDYKTRSRYNDANEMMRSIAARLSDDEIAALSEYLSGLQ
jgi:cytochrome c553